MGGGGKLTPAGLENLKAFICSEWREAGRYFTRGRFKKGNLYMDCLEDRHEVEGGLSSLSRLLCDDPSYVFLLTTWSFCSRACQHFSSSRRLPGTSLGSWQACLGPAVGPFSLLRLESLLRSTSLEQRGPVCYFQFLKESLPFEE